MYIIIIIIPIVQLTLTGKTLLSLISEKKNDRFFLFLSPIPIRFIRILLVFWYKQIVISSFHFI